MPKLDPLLRLALAVHENPGVYALLLGSGISRSAGVPTGWEIVLDLVRRVAAMSGESEIADPAAWYRSKFGGEPDYSGLVGQLASTPAERRGLLSRYLEPTAEEKSQGIKIPTAAHRAIAKLAEMGYVRVILTTNFDRLMEEALADAGVIHDVVTTDDDLRGLIPYVHGGCVLLKLHGDYRDTRIKNTTRELSKYSKALNDILDRIFDEFGLIVAGWSGDFDVALREAIRRCRSRRYSTFWLARSDPSVEASEVILARRGEIIKIRDADSGFSKLLEMTISLDESAAPHPISMEVAVATAKRQLADPNQRIALHDLLSRETEDVVSGIVGRPVSPGSVLTRDGFNVRVRRYEGVSQQLCAILSA